jgi:hypothetical protein
LISDALAPPASGNIQVMGDLKTSRWTRYGKDRIYVSTADGLRVGWLDLLTGSMTIEKPDLASEFHAALASVDKASSSHVVDGARGEAPVSQAAAWTDLALNRPGAGVRQRADEELAAMNEKSRIGTFLKRVLDEKTDERAWRVGARGEENVGRKLDKLHEHGCYVLHSIPVGDRGSDIDHLVIGRGGVYTVNSKRHPNKHIVATRTAVRVDGHNNHVVEKSEHEGERVKKLLTARVGFEVPVRPVLVFLTFTAVTQLVVKDQPEVVAVLPVERVPGWFKKVPERLTREQIDAVYEMARRSTTWVK